MNILARRLRFKAGISLLGLALAFAPAQAFAEPYYQGISLYDTFNAPAAVATGDFNGDGNADLAFANQMANKIDVRLGYGDGTFDASVSTDYFVGDAPCAIEAADMNKDGKLDLVVANRVSQNISILLGNGDGTFGAAVQYQTGASTLPTDLVVADIDGDSDPDIAVVDNAGYVILMYNDDHGQIGLIIQVDLTAAGQLESIAAGDLNKDGKIDFVVTSPYVSPSDPSEYCVLLSKNNGGFDVSTHQLDATGNEDANTIEIADIVGSGNNLDLVIGTDTNLLVYPGNGDGSFGSESTYPAKSLQGLAIGDFDRNGGLDVAATDSNRHVVSVWYNSGAGLDSTPVFYSTDSTPKSLVSADFDNDGYLDLVVGNWSVATFTAMRNDGTGSFESPTAYLAGSSIGAIATADFNGDWRNDIVTVLDGNGKVDVALSNGDGTFKQSALLTAGTSPIFVIARDFNADLKIDLAVLNQASNNIMVFFGNGDGTFIGPAAYPLPVMGSYPTMFVAADVNNDSVTDLITTDTVMHTVSVFLGNKSPSTQLADGTFAYSNSYPTGPSATSLLPYGIVVGDFNEDGNQDLAVANSDDDEMGILFGAGDGSFGTPSIYALPSNAKPTVLAADDYDGDGHADLAIALSGPGFVSVALGNGDGTFKPYTSYTSGSNPRAIVSGDFNRDAKIDLAVANKGGNSVRVLIGQGDGTFIPEDLLYTGKFAMESGVAAADFTGNANFDQLAIAENNWRRVTIVDPLQDRGSISLQSAAYGVNENEAAGYATITLTRAFDPGSADGTASVYYETTNGSATAGTDYKSVHGKVVFHGNETTASFRIPIINNTAYVGDRTVNISISDPLSGTRLGAVTTAVLTIAEDDAQGGNNGNGNQAPQWPNGSVLSLSNVTQSSVTLTWPAATDDVGVTEYQVFVDGSATPVANLSGGTLAYTATGLSSGAPHSFIVKAADADGATSAALSNNATTLSAGGSSSSGPSTPSTPSTPTTPTTPTEPQTPVTKPDVSFTDIAGHWAEKTIIEAVGQGIASGYPDHTFKPDRPITRAEFATLLMAAWKPQITGSQLNFADLDSIGEWARDAISKAVALGVLVGYGDGTFRPDRPVTRAEMAKMIGVLRGAASSSSEGTGFADDADIPDWARAAVVDGVGHGIFQGRGANRFVPNGIATRAEAVAVLLKALKLKP